MTCTYFPFMFRLGGFSDFTPSACGYLSTIHPPRVLIRCLNIRLATLWNMSIPSKVLSSLRLSNWVVARLPCRADGVYTSYYMSAHAPQEKWMNRISRKQGPTGFAEVTCRS